MSVLRVSEYIDRWASSREILGVEEMSQNGRPEELNLLCLLGSLIIVCKYLYIHNILGK